MKIELRSFLRGNADITALVGQRIDWGMRPYSGLPAVRLWVIDQRDTYTYTDADGLLQTRVQIDVAAATYGAADRAAKAIRDVLSGHGTATGGVSIQRVFFEGARDSSEKGNTEAEELHVISLEFLITHREVTT